MASVSNIFKTKRNLLTQTNRVFQNLIWNESRRCHYSTNSKDCMDLEAEYSAHNYHPLPVVFSRAKDTRVWDPEGKEYIDFLSAYSAVNQGHLHPKLIETLNEQLRLCSLSSRAFYNDKFPLFSEFITKMFGYDMVLPMNTGAEGVETAIKLARKWGYEKKKIKKDQAIIVSCCNCFHGRTMAAISMSCDNDAVNNFSPLLKGQMKVDFGDVEGLKMAFEKYGDRIAGFIFEPIQGEAGVILPPEGYFPEVEKLCKKFQVLTIADEIQTGIARSGKMLASDWENIKPDILILGKSLGGGITPISVVLSNKHIMECIRPGEHGSTFGGNPLSSAIAITALNIVKEEKLEERSFEMGALLRQQLSNVQSKLETKTFDFRGRGLLNAIEMLSPRQQTHKEEKESQKEKEEDSNKKDNMNDKKDEDDCISAFDVCLRLKERGILAKPTHESIIRLSPPLTITPSDITKATDALYAVLTEDMDLLKKMAKQKSTSSFSSEGCHRCGRRRSHGFLNSGFLWEGDV